MKKFFQVIGMISLISFSFFFTEKTASVVKEQDQLMIEIKDKSKNFYVEPIDAKINKNTIIPGIYGKKINLEESYIEIKKTGAYLENLLVFKTIKPAVTIENNYDKYIISGNKKFKNISLVFLVEENSNVDRVLNVLKSKKVEATFFLDGLFVENNTKKLEVIKSGNNTLGNLSYRQNYEDSSFVWVNTVIKKIMNMKNSYCYTEKENKKVLDICNIQKNYTVIPNIIVKDNLVSEIKKSITNGSIISLKINEKTLDELPVLINYIESKGFNIVNLDELIKEKR